MNLVSAAALAGLVAMGGWFDQVEGNGKIKEEARQVEAFTGVEVGGGLEAELHIGKEQKVVVVTDENLLPLVKTTVKNGVLHVEETGNVHATKRTKVYVVAPTIDSIDASGGTKVRADVAKTPTFKLEGSGGADVLVRGIDADAVTLDLSGGVEARLSGQAKKGKIELSGGVTLTADGLQLEDAKLDASGGVDAVIAVSKSLSGDAAGGVSVKVKGTPAVNVDTGGGASVSTGR